MRGFWKKESGFFLILVCFSLLLFFLDRLGRLGFLHRLVDPPILAAEEKIYSLNRSFGQLFNFFTPLIQKDKEIEAAEEKLRQLAVEQGQLSACLEENEHLKKLLGSPLSPKWKFIEARVVGGEEKMRLDRGKAAGIEAGMTVISENILVGKVISVTRNSSLVRLPDDPDSKVPVVVRKPTAKSVGGEPIRSGIEARGLLQGQYGRKLLLDRALQEEDFQPGDLVITSGEGEWPVGLVIGLIEEVLPKSAEVYRQAVVLPLVDYRQLEMVFIIIDT